MKAKELAAILLENPEAEVTTYNQYVDAQMVITGATFVPGVGVELFQDAKPDDDMES